MLRVCLYSLVLSVILLAACQAPTTPAGPSAPTAVVSRTPVPPPAQPTSLPVATRAVAPFASATFSSIISVPPTSGAATTAPIGAATPASVQPGAAQPPAGPTAPGVATGVRSELKVEFVDVLATVEDAQALFPVISRSRGILDVSGNEIGLTIAYDAGLITPAQIRQVMASIGHPVKP